MSQDRNEFDDLEAMLRQLPLKQPSVSLDSRIRRLTQRGTAGRWIAGIIGASLAAAAMLLIAFWPASPTAGPVIAKATTPAAQPKVELVSTAEQWQDEGIVGYASDGPVRQYRLQSVQELASANAPGARYLYQEHVVQVVSEPY